MDYSEIAPPPAIGHLVMAGWTLDVPADGPAWVDHVAVPDGCMEIIRRLDGRSNWDGEQPDCFVAGAISRPTRLRLSRGSRFVALRIWPWTWRAISGHAPVALFDRWVPLFDAAPSFAMPADLEAAFAAVADMREQAPPSRLVTGILTAPSCYHMSAATGLSPRSLQRWFHRHVGLAPRSWLRLRRFNSAFSRLPASATALAGHAAEHGFADQAHMAREFRALAGAPAGKLRNRAHGPFIAPDPDRG